MPLIEVRRMRQWVLECVVTVYLCIYGWMDLRSGMVDLPVSLAALAVGTGWKIFCAMTDPMSRSLLSEGLAGCLPGLILLPFSLSTSPRVGSGDVITLLVTGFLLGFGETFELLFLALIGAGVYGAAMIFGKKRGAKSTFPFIPFLLLAQILRMIMGIRV